MPASFTPKTRGSESKGKTSSQTLSTNMSAAEAKVSDVLASKDGGLFWINPDDTVAHAVEVLRDKGIGALLVKNPQGDLVGILSERDIVRRLADTPGKTLPQTVKDLMSTDVVTATPDQSVVEVLRRMTDGRFRHMPVVEQDQLVGMITIGDVVKAQIAELAMEKDALQGMIMGY